MSRSLIGHLHFGGANTSFLNKPRLFFIVAVLMLMLSGMKTTVQYFGVDLPELNSPFDSGMGGAILIIGFLLSSILANHKEAERILDEIRESIEVIDVNEPRSILIATIDKLRVGLRHESDHKDIPPVLAEIVKSTTIFRWLEGMGMAANLVVRLRTTQDALRRSALRIYQVQSVEFVPSVHVLVQTLALSILVLMLLLKTEGGTASAILFGSISYMFVYIPNLIQLLKQLFAKGRASVDDVSLFLLYELETRRGQALEPTGRRKAGEV